MAARPDMTLRKVWGNIEKQKTLKGIEYPELAVAMHISVKTLYTRRNQPATLRGVEIVRAANFFNMNPAELFS